MEMKTQFSVWYFAFSLLAVMFVYNTWGGMRAAAPIPYSESLALLKDGNARFVTPRVEPALTRDLAQYDVKFTGVVESTLLRDVLGWVTPAVVFVAIWLFLMRRCADKMGGGSFMSIGKSKAKGELMEIVGFLKNRRRFGRLGSGALKGVLLVGPPGTGKTLLARAVTGAAGLERIRAAAVAPVLPLTKAA